MRSILAVVSGFTLILLLWPYPGAAQDPDVPDSGQILPLTRVATRACDHPGGWSNLFFHDAPGVTGVSIALFAELPGGQRLEVVRSDDDGGGTYGLRTSADAALQPLSFVELPNGRCATLEVPLEQGFGTVRLQVLLADQYIYGRVAEHREALLVTGAGQAKIELHPRTRGTVHFNNTAEMQVLVDADLDGEIRRTTTMQNESVVLGEEFGEYFLAGGHAYVIDSISSDARYLHVSGAGDAAAPIRGFRAPRFSGIALDGSVHRLSDYAGRPVVIEFWSTQCPFSEQARPQAAALARQIEARGGVYVTMARESDRAAVQAHVLEHARGGVLLVREDESWQRWNPETATPLFFVIATDGTVQLRVVGAAAVRLVAATVGVELPQEPG